MPVRLPTTTQKVDHQLVFSLGPANASGAPFPLACAEVISIPEALRESTLQTIRAERSFLLFPSVLEPLRLKEGGFPLEEVNVGGLHHAPGKSAVLPYVYLDQGDREKLLALSRLGVRLVAQDLPTNPAHPLEPFLQGTP